MKVLIIDNTMDPGSWGSEPIRRFVRAIPSATLLVRRAPHEDLPPSPRAFDRIIASGSRTSAIERNPWVERLDAFIRETVEAGVPFFGICYGHQSLARALGGEACVSNGTAPEFGWGRIRMLSSSPLFQGLPEEFHSFQTHSDEVTKLPAGMRQLATSDGCAIQACEVVGKPAYGVQFHPEKSLEDAERSIQLDIPKHRTIMHAKKGRELFDPSVGEKIFMNFLEQR